MDRPYRGSRGPRPLTIAVPTGPHTSERLTLNGPKPNWVRRTIRQKGLLGFGGRTGAALLALMESKPDGVFLDIGANMGIYAALVAKAFPQSTVYAFEPAGDTRANLEALVSANGLSVTPLGIALSDRSGTAELIISEASDASNSLVAGHRAGVGVQQVTVDTLDSWAATNGAAPSLLKIDVERHEAAVLTGAARVLREHRPLIVIELLAGTGPSKLCPEAAAARDLAVAAGYSLERVRTPVSLRGRLTSKPCDDYVLWPGEPDPSFEERYVAWLEALMRLRSAASTARRQASARRASRVGSSGAAQPPGDPAVQPQPDPDVAP